MVQPLPYLRETPSQTAGPFVHIGLTPSAAGSDVSGTELGRDPAGPNAAGERIAVEGVILDGTGTPLRDAVVEVWQANAAGVHASPLDPRHGEVEEGFRGWARCHCDLETGLWRLDTIKPGRVPARRTGVMAPHLNLWIIARGINIGLHTRMYFADEAGANGEDPVLGLIEPAHRRATLVAERTERDGPALYRFDIRLQGDGETVFLDV